MRMYIKNPIKSRIIGHKLERVIDFIGICLFLFFIITFLLAKIYHNFPGFIFPYSLILIASFQLSTAVYFEKTGGFTGVQVTKKRAIIAGVFGFFIFALSGVLLLLPYMLHAKIHFFFVGLILLFPVIVIFLRTIRKI